LPEPEVTLAMLDPGEVEAVSEMAARIWPAAYGAILPEGQVEYMLSRMYDPEQLRRDLAEGVAFFWILDAADRVGFLAAGPIEPGLPCALHKCYLLPEVHGCGIGSAALFRLGADLAAAGATSLELRVNRNNARAIAFYRKNGFTVYAEDCREFGHGFVMDDFLMRKELPLDDPTAVEPSRSPAAP